MKRFVLIFVFVFTSCQSDVNNVTIKGVVENNKTNKPLADIQVSFINWYFGNSADQSYSGKEEVTVTTNDKGEYQVNFDQSAFLEIKIEQNGFLNFHETEYITNKRNTINIDLVPN